METKRSVDNCFIQALPQIEDPPEIIYVTAMKRKQVFVIKLTSVSIKLHYKMSRSCLPLKNELVSVGPKNVQDRKSVV